MGDTKTAKATAGADEVVAIGPDDEGLGNGRPDEVVAIGPDDEGVGSVRPHVNPRRSSARWTCQRT